MAGAADRLHLSSPAVSRSLGRIRRLTGDEILVRSGRAMIPTPFAISVREEVGRLVRQARSVLKPPEELNLAGVERTFTIRSHEGLAVALTPTLLESVLGQAPGVRLRVLVEDSVDTDDLRRGHVDLQLGEQAGVGPEFQSEIIGHDRLVVAMRSDHPCCDHLGLDEFVDYPHIAISRRGRLTSPIDDALADLGLERRVTSAVGTSTIAMRTARGSDALVLTSVMASRPLVEAFGLTIQPLPAELPTPTMAIYSTWHRRFDGDGAHAWLREQVRQVATQIAEV